MLRPKLRKEKKIEEAYRSSTNPINLKTRSQIFNKTTHQMAPPKNPQLSNQKKDKQASNPTTFASKITPR